MDRVWIVVGLLMSFAWACAGVWIACGEVLRSRHTKVWPSVIGQVLDSQVEVGGDNDNVYNVKIEYQYSVFGRPYKGSESILTPWGLSGKESRENAEDVSDSYPVGLELKIAYNPKRPRESIIADDARRRVNNVTILSGFIIIMTGLLGIFLVAGEAP